MERARVNDSSGREKGRKRGKNGTERESERETRRERAIRRETRTRREREHERYRDRERVDISQTGSRSRSTNSNNASVVTDAEEESIASRIRNKRRKETAIRQDAEYWQTNGKTTKMKKINSYEY